MKERNAFVAFLAKLFLARIWSVDFGYCGNFGSANISNWYSVVLIWEYVHKEHRAGVCSVIHPNLTAGWVLTFKEKGDG